MEAAPGQVELSLVLPVKNRPGMFAVLEPRAAERIAKGYMTIYAQGERLIVETVTRNRQPLYAFDPDYRTVLIALDQQGRLALNTP